VPNFLSVVDDANTPRERSHTEPTDGVVTTTLTLAAAVRGPGHAAAHPGLVDNQQAGV